MVSKRGDFTNTLESYNITNPAGIIDECAKFNIEDTSVRFALNNITTLDQEYTLTFWISALEKCQLQILNTYIEVSTEWQQYIITFKAASKSIWLQFQNVGTYFIYHPQLELGNQSTDWARSPDDMATTADLQLTQGTIQILQESVSSLLVESDSIKAEVMNVQNNVDSVTENLLSTQSKIASMELASEALQVDIQKINDNGVSKVVTATGFTFDFEGMTVDSTEKPTKTQVTPDGMIVYRKSYGGQTEVLKATSDGVDATNLRATTYLIVGGRSRFENYGNDRTGCFWIGG